MGRSSRLPWVVLALLAIWLFHRASGAAVDLLFWDQWDFWEPLFDGSGPGAAFLRQHGPQRQGLGGLVIWLVARATGWNVRAEVFASCAITVAGAGVFLWVAPSLRSDGRLDRLDSVLPLLLLPSLHADGAAVTPNPAHGPVPFALACMAPAILGIPRLAVRLPLLAGLAVAATFTGFAYLLAPVVVAVLAVEAARTTAPGRRLAFLVTIGVVLLGSATFFLGFLPTTAVDCFQFPTPRPLELIPFTAVVLLRPLGLDSPRALPIVASVLAAVPLLCAGVVGAFSYLARPAAAETRRRLDEATFLLCGFAGAFALATAIGRVCLGVPAAAMPRYAPYVIPALAVSWLALRERVHGKLLAACATPILAATLLQEGRLAIRAAPEDERIARGKRAFRECLLRGGSAGSCAREVRFEIHPEPERTRLEQKVEFLRSRSLGPFRR